jgi:hypothetical protein
MTDNLTTHHMIYPSNMKYCDVNPDSITCPTVCPGAHRACGAFAHGIGVLHFGEQMKKIPTQPFHL